MVSGCPSVRFSLPAADTLGKQTLTEKCFTAVVVVVVGENERKFNFDWENHPPKKR